MSGPGREHRRWKPAAAEHADEPVAQAVVEADSPGQRLAAPADRDAVFARRGLRGGPDVGDQLLERRVVGRPRIQPATAPRS